MRQVSVITISDSAFSGTRTDESGPALVTRLTDAGYTPLSPVIVPDEWTAIAQAITHAADTLCAPLILTTGGTGFAPRDITPEVTRSLIEREVPGISEEMRRVGRSVTMRAILSRAVAGIRAKSLIINLPGSPKAALENLNAVLDVLPHALDILSEQTKNCAAGTVLSIHTSSKKGTQKQLVPTAKLITGHGIEGDAHADGGMRQISLLACESVDIIKKKVPDITPGAFAENILTKGIDLSTLPLKTKFQIGTAVCEITQIGKDCHDDGCPIRRTAGVCVMPTKGVFAQVIKDGNIQPGDSIFAL